MARPVETVPGDRQGIVARGGQSLALATLCTLLFLTFLDNTIVSAALGEVYSNPGASPTELQWVVGAYALTFASLMLACGMIGDELGRKKVMLAGAGVFCAGSVLCALAPNVQVLIAGRAVMGMGAAASEPGTLSMLRHLYPDAKARSRAIGVWAATAKGAQRALALAENESCQRERVVLRVLRLQPREELANFKARVQRVRLLLRVRLCRPRREVLDALHWISGQLESDRGRLPDDARYS